VTTDSLPESSVDSRDPLNDSQGGRSTAPQYVLSRWWTREWQKVVPEVDTYRFYRVCLQQNLWGEWELTVCWGRIGGKPSRTLIHFLPNPEAAEAFVQAIDRKRQKRGYRPLVQRHEDLTP
jgi:predicted DNA-binding WGR domain protein